MLTNLVVLSIALVTNSQQAIIGEANGKALVASQETIVQRTITLEDVVLRSTVSTNVIGFAFPRVQPPTTQTLVPTNLTMSPELSKTVRDLQRDTNSPAYKHRLEREQRMKPQTNAPPVQGDPRK